MATTTPRLGLTKPDGTDLVDIAVINANYDILDDQLVTTPSTNYVINGAFDFWQRGTTAYVVDSYGSADRWLFSRGTLAQQTFTPGAQSWATSQYYANFSYTGQVFAYMEQRIEDVRALAGQTVTISFYAKSSASSSITLRIAQNYGTGGSTATYSFPTTFNLNTSWTRYTYTANIPSVSGKTVGPANTSFTGLGFYGTLGTAVTGNFDIANIQVETGNIATTFRRNANSLQGELAACQRYYYRQGGERDVQVFTPAGYADQTTTAIFNVILPVKMRTYPSSLEYSTLWVSSGPSNYAVTSLSYLASTSSTIARVYASVASGLTQWRPYELIAASNIAGYVAINAEL